MNCHMIPANRVLYSARLHRRANTQARPAARQAGEEVKREKLKVCRTGCISRLSRSESSEGMRLALQNPRSPVGALHR